MNEISLIQGTEEWRIARLGSLGASSVHSALAKTKSGWGSSRANLISQLITERLTGLPTESFTNSAMQWGVATEAQARAAYSFYMDSSVPEVGLIRHPQIQWSHASPDGLVGEDGLIEIKCPSSATHLDTLLGAKIDLKYIYQIQWQMACTARRWCDFVSFDPRLPVELQMKTIRVERDDPFIADLEREVSAFLAEIDSRIKSLKLLINQ